MVEYVTLFIIIADSSPTDYYLENDAMLREIQEFQNIKHLQIKNLGAPHALNHAIEYAKTNYNPDLIMILTDDAIVYSNIPYNSIYQYFNKYCNPDKDILLITDEKKVPRKIIKRTTENGMLFSPLLFNNIKFSENLIMDQFDLIFCDEVYLTCGKIIVFPDSIIWQDPIGREERNGNSYLPSWRIYLLIRNTISLWLRGKESFFYDVLVQNLHQLLRVFLYSNKRLQYIKAVFLGVLDGLTHQLGVTKELQELSGKRFWEGEKYE